MTLRRLNFIPLLVILILGFLFWRGLHLNPRLLPSTLINKPLPTFHLPLLENESQHLSNHSLKGEMALLHVFASWCTACAEEQGFLMQLAQRGLPIYGINYKDSKDELGSWLKAYGNPYKKIGLDESGLAMIDLGVYGTPETFLIDNKGAIRYRLAGRLNEKIWESEFLPRMRALEGRV